jgi:hypothetical protein
MDDSSFFPFRAHVVNSEREVALQDWAMWFRFILLCQA